MTQNIKPPAWYRQQAAETRDKATLIGGPYGALLMRLSEQWDKLAQQVASMTTRDTDMNKAEVIDLDRYRAQRSA
jgi:hypothetical protein